MDSPFGVRCGRSACRFDWPELAGGCDKAAPPAFSPSAAHSLQHNGCGSCANEWEGVLRVLLIGATGLIGSAVLTRLLKEKHDVVAVARPGGARDALGASRWLAVDIAKATRVEDWLAHLAAI